MKKEIFALPLTGNSARDGAVRVLVGEVYYNKGGYSYFSGQSTPRSYIFSVFPQQRTDKMQITGMFSGIGVILEETKRFSSKRLAEINPSNEQKEKLIADVLKKNNLSLEVA